MKLLLIRVTEDNAAIFLPDGQFIHLDSGPVNTYFDKGIIDIDETYDSFLNLLTSNGYSGGYIDNIFSDDKTLTREVIAEALKMFNLKIKTCEFIEIDANNEENIYFVNLYFCEYRVRHIIFTPEGFYIKDTIEKYKIISLFAGCGGFDLGFRRAGFDIRWAIDYNRDACNSYRINFPKTFLVQKDIRYVKDNQFPKNIELVIGAYPCQGFSEAGKQRLDDERNFLYREFGRALSIVQPKMFCAENVSGLLEMAEGKVIAQMVKEFEEKNFRVEYKMLDAKDFGIAQDRKRVFIVGIREDLDLEFHFPRRTHGVTLLPYRTLKDAIWKDRENPGDYYKGSYNERYMARQRVRKWNHQSYCIVASANNVPQHPDSLMKWIAHNRYEFIGNSNRSLSVKECASIQSFPEYFKIYGNLISKYRQIGNAVPPLLAYRIALSIKNCLDGIKIRNCDHWCKIDSIPVKEIKFCREGHSINSIYLCKSCMQEEFLIDWNFHHPEHILLANPLDVKVK